LKEYLKTKVEPENYEEEVIEVKKKNMLNPNLMKLNLKELSKMKPEDRMNMITKLDNPILELDDYS
jgi:hypothetical protein